MTSQVTGSPAAFARADVVQRGRRGHVRQVEPGARHVPHDIRQDRDRSGHRAGLGRHRPAPEAQHRRDVPLGGLGALGQGGVLGVVDDRQSQRPRVDERVAQDRRRAYRGAVVGEADDARIGQLAERRQRVTGPPVRDRSVDEDPDRGA